MENAKTARIVTMQQIAELAGCSQPTVSFVLNGKASGKKISAELERTVLEIAERLGYRPRGRARNAAAPGARRPSHMLGFMIPTIAFSYWAEVVYAAEDFLGSQGYRMLFLQTGIQSNREVEIINHLLDYKLDALVLSSRLNESLIVSQLRKISAIMPVVSIGTQFETWDCDSVTTADLYGGRAATEHLVSHGHRLVAHLSGPSRTWAGRHRRLGYEDALRAGGLTVDELLIETSDFDLREGYKAMTRLLRRVRPTAVFAASDSQAMGAYFALADAGLRVPHDCALVGYDDLAQGEYFHMPLTSMRQPRAEYGALACHRALELIRNFERRPSPTHHQLMPQLVVRESCGTQARDQRGAPVPWRERLGI